MRHRPHRRACPVPPWLAHRPSPATPPEPTLPTEPVVASLATIDNCPDCGEELEVLEDWNVLDEEAGLYCCPVCGWELWI